MRGVRYGEVLAMFLRDTGLEAEVYGTQMVVGVNGTVVVPTPIVVVVIRVTAPSFSLRPAVMSSGITRAPAMLTTLNTGTTAKVPSTIPNGPRIVPPRARHERYVANAFPVRIGVSMN